MERREVLSALVMTPLAGIGQTKPKNRHLVVIRFNVGSLPALRAMSLVERVRENFKKDKPDGIVVLFIPQRSDPTSFEVYALDGETIPSEDRAWIERFVFKHNKLKYDFRSVCEQTDEQIIMNTKIMLGAPNVVLPSSLDDEINKGIELGRKFMVQNLAEFVWEYMENIRWYYGDYWNGEAVV